MKFLITGGAGYIGSTIASAMLDNGHTPVILDNFSVEKPYEYYHENVAKSLELFRALNRLGCKRVLFSSSASIYDMVPDFMVTETSPLNPSSPYARTKYMMEMVLRDFCAAYGMRGIALRYFNPIGAEIGR